MSNTPSYDSNQLLYAFRYHYTQFQELILNIHTHSTDSFLLSQIQDDIQEFQRRVTQNAHIFDTEEYSTLTSSLHHMLHDIRLEYQQAINSSHQGFPEIISLQRDGSQGRPRVVIDEEFLRWAHTQRTTSGIARFLNISRQVVRNHLLDYGIVSAGSNPFPQEIDEERSIEDVHISNSISPLHHVQPEYENLTHSLSHPSLLLNHQEGNPIDEDSTHHHIAPNMFSAGSHQLISDDELDRQILQFHTSFPRAGITMLDGMLRHIGYRIPRSRISAALARINPVQRVFQRIRIRRRGYSVPGPNALWHHDGQHGLIRWGIVIHGFIDGYSRLITGLRASNNNLASTVLNVFVEAIEKYGIPSRLRGDHGVENLAVAAFMQSRPNAPHGAYIWGRSVHNIRIERLWVDVTAQVGASWHDIFMSLELHYGLDIHNENHIWLLHHFFLPIVNNQLEFFTQAWNQHRIQIRNGPNRSPADMFVFDMLVHGIRGEEVINDDELEMYGVDWDALHNEDLVISRTAHPQDESTDIPWLADGRPEPEHMNEVPVFAPPHILSQQELTLVSQSTDEIIFEDGNLKYMEFWTTILLSARALRPLAF